MKRARIACMLALCLGLVFSSVSVLAQKSSPPATEKINLNSATVEQLQSLPGIGPATAKSIVEYRTKAGKFNRIEEIINIKGIGEKKFQYPELPAPAKKKYGSFMEAANDIMLRTQKTITGADILRGGETGIGTYRYSVFTRTLATCGNVLYSPTDDAQDIGVNALIAAKTDKMHIDSEPFNMPFVADATIAGKIAKLYFQRKLLTKSEERMTVKATCVALDPGDFITVSGDNYGGEHPVIVDSMTIRKDCSIDLTCTGYTDTIDNYS